MVRYYNAFISYKHSDLDNKVATEVHRGLEHFKIPRAICKKTGQKRIERIFRDKDELPITSNLSDNIAEALTNAEYLIVICSQNTKKSAWVPREIEHFLKSHKKDHVLTVLAGGETKDVIPEMLRNDERLVTDENNQEHLVSVPIEPLSCDFRTTKKRVRKAELTRLAAAIIGCSYDELIQRQRQYKKRRMMAVLSTVFAGVVLFGIYMAYSKHKINKYYTDALNSQSQYLANESLRLLGDNQRAEALQLALASVPVEGPDRPVLPETIKALTQATFAYQHEDSDALTEVWNYTMPALVVDFVVSTDSAYMAALDEEGNLTVWEINSHNRVYESEETRFQKLYALNQNSLLVRDDEGFCSINILSGDILWRHLFTKSESLYYGWKGDVIDIDTSRGTLFAPLDNNSYIFLDINDGTVIQSIAMPEQIGEYPIGSYTNEALSPNGKHVAAIAIEKCTSGEDYEHILCDYDIETSEVVSYLVLDQYSLFSTISWGDDTHIVIAEPDSENQSGRINDAHFYSDDTYYISCFDSELYDIIWKVTMPKSGPDEKFDFVRLEDRNAILFYCADAAYAYDIQTGSIVFGGHVSGEIIDVSETGKSGYPVLFTDLGEFCTIDPDNTIYPPGMPKDKFISIRSLPFDVDKVISCNGDYLVHIRNDRNILLYEESAGDDEWLPLAGGHTHESVYFDRYIFEEGILAVLNVEDDGSVRITIYDVDEGCCTGSIDMSEYSVPLMTTYHFVAVIEDTVLVTFTSRSYGTELYRIDKSGQIIDIESIDGYFQRGALYCDEKVFFEENVDSVEALSIYDLKTSSKESIPLGEEGVIDSVKYLPSSGIVVCNATVYIFNDKNEVVDYTPRVFILDLATKEVIDISSISDTWKSFSFVSENNSGTMIAIADEDEVYVVDRKGNVISTIDCNGMTPLGVAIVNINKDDLLLVSYSRPCLCRYDPSTGELFGQTDIALYQYEEGVSFIVDEKNHQLFVHSQGLILNIIDTDGWILCGYIMDCLGYSEETDRFVTANGYYNEKTIGYYKHYSLDDLVEKAKRLLNGEEMSAEMKYQYGLS